MNNPVFIIGLTDKDRNAINEFAKKDSNTPKIYQVAAFAAIGLLSTTAIPHFLVNKTESNYRRPVDGRQVPNGSWEGHSVTLTTTNATVVANFSERINQLKEKTGLTWSQIARLFDVSTRAVHHWAAGGKMNSFNIETINYLESNLFVSDNSLSPDERKAKIFTSNKIGKTIFDISLERYLGNNFNNGGNALGASAQIDSL